jgi:hypothetical protein
MGFGAEWDGREGRSHRPLGLIAPTIRFRMPQGFGENTIFYDLAGALRAGSTRR